MAAVMVATALGAFLPRALSTGDQAPVVRTVTVGAQEPPVAPTGCFVVSCGKGTPTPGSPTLTLAALFSVVAGLSAYVARTWRRTRIREGALPRGTAPALWRPPQFSS